MSSKKEKILSKNLVKFLILFMIVFIIIVIFIIKTNSIKNVETSISKTNENTNNINNSINLESEKTNNTSNTEKSLIGNTIGNIRNCGYATIQNEWVYYIAPNEDMSKTCIFKIKEDGTEKQKIYTGEDLLSLNVYNDYLFFIQSIGTGIKLCSLKTDGTQYKELNVNINKECYEIYALDNSIYYIGVDENIYKINLDGTNVEMVSDNGTGYIGITDKYIIYNVENETGDNYITYIMNIDGTNKRAIISGKRLYDINYQDEYIYYLDKNNKIYRTKIDSNKEELIFNGEAYNLNLKDNYLYFLSTQENSKTAIFRVKIDSMSNEAELIKTLENTSSFLNIVGNQIVYMDNTDSSAYINMLKIDERSEIKLYELRR